MSALKNQSLAGRSAFTALAVTIATLCASTADSRAQVEILTASGNITQDFNGLLSTPTTPQTWTNDTTLTAGDSTLNGWSLFNFSSAPLTTYTPGTGSSNGGSFYSFGTAADDRALGGVGSGGAYFGAPAAGTVAGYIAFAATNNSTSSITSFDLDYDGEQWRNGGNTTAQTMAVEIGFGATFATTDFVALSPSYGFTGPIVGAAAATLDGNASANRLPDQGGTVNFLNWAPGTTMWIRFVENNDAGNDHGLALDDFNLGTTGGTVKTLTWAPTTNVWDTTGVNWQDATPAASAFAFGDAVSFTDSGLAAQSTVAVAAGGVTPSSISVSNTSGIYTIMGGTITSLLPLQKSGAGTLVLGSSYSSGVNATGGTIRTMANEVIGDTAKVALTGATLDLNGRSETIGKLELTAATITTGDGTLTVGGPVTVKSAATETTISGQFAAAPAPAGITITLADGAAGEDLVLDADLVGGGRVAFAGAGTVRIAGDNVALSGGLTFGPGVTYLVDSDSAFGTGQLRLNGGTIDSQIPLTGDDAISAAVSLGNTTGAGATFTGEDVEFSGAVTFFITAAKRFTIAEDTTVTFSGSITGAPTANLAPDITKLGLGTLVFKNDAPAFSGAVRVEAGEVIADKAGSLGSGAVTVAPTSPDTALLTINASQTLTSLTIGAGGVVVLSEDISPAPGGFAAVPEPGSLGLVALGALGLFGRRRTVRGISA